MLNNLDWLIRYKEQLNELNSLKKELEESGVYDKIEISIPQGVLIMESWTNEHNEDSKTYRFKLSEIPEISEKIRKKIDYRKGLLNNKKKPKS